MIGTFFNRGLAEGRRFNGQKYARQEQ